jgi:hypothetical protein
VRRDSLFQKPNKFVGNFYSIENDYDKPARIFFSQGCEVLETTETY